MVNNCIWRHAGCDIMGLSGRAQAVPRNSWVGVRVQEAGWACAVDISLPLRVRGSDETNTETGSSEQFSDEQVIKN